MAPFLRYDQRREIDGGYEHSGRDPVIRDIRTICRQSAESGMRTLSHANRERAQIVISAADKDRGN